MNILVDHGSYLNLGDVAILESAVTRLHHALPDAQLHVVYRDMPTKIYQAPCVTRVPNYEIELAAKNRLQPLLGTKSDSAAVRVGLIQLALGKRATGLTITQNNRRLSADEFCKPYDALHLVGGGMLNDVFPMQLLKKSALLLTFAAQHKPAMLSGQQLGPFQNALFKRVLVRALRT